MIVIQITINELSKYFLKMYVEFKTVIFRKYRLFMMFQ